MNWHASIACCSGLLPPRLRFVMLVTDHHARLGTRPPCACPRHVPRMGASFGRIRDLALLPC